MNKIKYIDKDFVTFRFKNKEGKSDKVYLAFGDKVEVLSEGETSRIKALELWSGTKEGTVKGTPFRDWTKGVMKFSMVDVQQGDGMIIEMPPDASHNSKIMFVDGGDNKLFARHAAARFKHRKSTKENRLDIDLILITHGDADHYEGLSYIAKSETENINPKKRLFIKPKRIYHNGLVKKPVSNGNGKRRKDVEMFGDTIISNETTYITNLYKDPRETLAKNRNRPFNRWVKCIDHWDPTNHIDVQRVAYGMNVENLFSFLGSVKVDIQGPFTEKIKNQQNEYVEGLRFLHRPKKSSMMHVEQSTQSKTLSASHTINGHSIALRMTYKNVRFNLTGDLNQESMEIMRENLSLNELESEIVKAPHHGSHDFDLSALRAMSPVVSLISSGDESSRKEHIHPRATLVAALGKVSRGDTAVVLCTELAAFFEMKGYSHSRSDISKYYKSREDDEYTGGGLGNTYSQKIRSKKENIDLPSFYAFERTNFGIIHIRTDGERVLVFTHSGKDGMREAYSFQVDENHNVTFNEKVSIG